MVRFGTGGWRAIIGDEFTKENVRLLAAGLAKQMDEEGLQGSELCIGYDRRFLSPEAAHWAAEVLAGSGYRVMMVNKPSPTPLMMFMVRERGLPYGMAVTASHNPALYNGIKLFLKGGRDADKEFTGSLEKITEGIRREDIRSVSYERALAQGLIREEDPTEEYLQAIRAMLDTQAIRRAGLHIALDPMYGVSGECMQKLFEGCGCKVEMIHTQHDPLFGGLLPAPNPETTQELAAFTVEKQCNVGIASDGDGDRLGVIDENGEYVDANRLTVLLYYYLVKYRGWKGPCVRNNATTQLLDRVAADLGEQCLEVPVGFKWVSGKMRETNAIIGGESSGGMAIRGHIAGKDGIYSAALIVEMLAVTGKSISQLYREITDRYGELFYVETGIRMLPEQKQQLQAEIFDEKKIPVFPVEVKSVNYLDGCKVLLADGSWTVCRFSGTEPVLRIVAEHETEEKAKTLVECWHKYLEL